VFYGDKLLLTGSLYRVPFFRLSPRFNYRDYLKNKGIYTILSVKKDAPIVFMARNKGFFIKRIALRLRHKMKFVIDSNIQTPYSSVYNAIILGKREGLPSGVRKMFADTGTIHILAISGLHVGIVAMIAFVFLKFLRIPKKMSILFTIALLVLYCLATGSRVPVVRATIMAAIFLLAFVVERDVDVYNALAIAGFAILVFNPRQFFSVSFQLSFISILSIIYFPPRIMHFFPDRLLKAKVALAAAQTVSLSMGVWLGLLPLIAYYFNKVSPVAVFANIIIVPYLTVVVFLAFLLIMTSFIVPIVAPAIGANCEVVGLILLRVVALFEKIPGAYFSVKEFPFYVVLIYYLFLIAILEVFKRQKTRKKLTFS
jgi:competence protein ComEC